MREQGLGNKVVRCRGGYIKYGGSRENNTRGWTRGSERVLNGGHGHSGQEALWWKPPQAALWQVDRQVTKRVRKASGVRSPKAILFPDIMEGVFIPNSITMKGHLIGSVCQRR